MTRATLAGRSFGSRDHLLKVLLLAAVYFGSAKLGLSLTVAHGNATPVWPPTGISLAALLLFGPRLWPGVFLGALLANATTPIPLWAAFGIAAGNTLEAVLGAFLLRRVGFRKSLDRVRDVLAIAILGGVVGTTVSATVGVTMLDLAGAIPSSSYGFHWEVWWVGDTMGALLIAPVLLAWVAAPRPTLSVGRLLEALALLGSLGAVGAIIFLGAPPAPSYAVFPFALWGALRFRQLGATTVALVVTTFGLVATLNGANPFGGETETEAVEILQAMMALVSLSTLVLAATISEREKAEDALRDEAVRRQTHAEQVRQMELRQRQALELNDEVVQGLAVAKLAFETGHSEDAERAVAETLTAAKQIVGDMLGNGEPVTFVRKRPAGSHGEVGNGEVRKPSPKP